jgi:hypothetical protein
MKGAWHSPLPGSGPAAIALAVAPLLAELRALEAAAASLATIAAVPGRAAGEQQERRRHREAMIEQARETVAEQLRLRADWSRIPDDAKPVLRGGWGPMMALRLVQHGAGSTAWMQGLRLLDRLLLALDPERPEARRSAASEGLMSELGDQMIEAGIPMPRIERMLHAYAAALRALPGVNPVSPTQAEPIAQAAAAAFA